MCQYSLDKHTWVFIKYIQCCVTPMFLVPAAGMTKKISLRKAPNWWSVRFGHKNTRVKIKHAWDSSNLSMQCNCGVGRSIRLCNTSSIFSQPIALGIVLGKCGAVYGWWMIALLFPSQGPGTLEHSGFGTTSGVTCLLPLQEPRTLEHFGFEISLFPQQ